MNLVADRAMSHEEEYESDTDGVGIAEKAGFDGEAAQSALAHLGFSSKTGVLDTHPAIQSRIRNLD